MVEIVKVVDNVCNMFLNVTDCFKTQKMHDKAVEKKSNYGKICFYSFINQECVKMLFQ